MKLFAVIVLTIYFLYKFFAGIYVLIKWDELTTDGKLHNFKKRIYAWGLLEHLILVALTLTIYFL